MTAEQDNQAIYSAPMECCGIGPIAVDGGVGPDVDGEAAAWMRDHYPHLAKSRFGDAIHLVACPECQTQEYRIAVDEGYAEVPACAVPR